MAHSSIITVCLNAGDALERTIQSVIAQQEDCPDLEYIIIDGGSTDDTPSVIERYRAHISVFVSESDRGVSDAFNKGIKRATGALVGILNAGDTYLPGAVLAAQRALQSDEYGFSFGDCVFVEDDGRRYGLPGDANYASSIRRRMPILNHPTVFVRRTVYERLGGFDERWRLAMDYELLLRFHLAGVRGIYIPGNAAVMPRDGISQQGYVRSLQEVRAISIEHGYSPLAAHSLYWVYRTRHILRRALEVAGLFTVLSAIRRRTHKGYTEEIGT